MLITKITSPWQFGIFFSGEVFIRAKQVFLIGEHFFVWVLVIKNDDPSYVV